MAIEDEDVGTGLCKQQSTRLRDTRESFPGRRFYVHVAAITLAFTPPAFAESNADLSRCRAIQDSLQRLVCYDTIPAATTVPSATKLAESPIVLTSAKMSIRRKNITNGIFSDRAELRSTFKNNSKKTLSAIMVSFTVKDSFGEVLLSNTDKLDLRVKPGETKSPDSLYFWEDNQFIHNEIYDKLIGPIESENTTVTASVKKAVFTDGSVEEY